MNKMPDKTEDEIKAILKRCRRRQAIESAAGFPAESQHELMRLKSLEGYWEMQLRNLIANNAANDMVIE